MLQESDHSRNPSYLAPCVLKAVHMIEALRETGTGLRVEGLRSITGYSSTTIYRILRTLVACGYVRRTSGGSYRLNNAAVPAVGRGPRDDGRDSHLAFPPKPNGTHRGGFERWLRLIEAGPSGDIDSDLRVALLAIVGSGDRRLAADFLRQSADRKMESLNATEPASDATALLAQWYTDLRSATAKALVTSEAEAIRAVADALPRKHTGKPKRGGGAVKRQKDV